MESMMQMWLAEKPHTTSFELAQMIKSKFGTVVSRQLVNLVLRKRLNISWKRTRKRGPRGVGWTDERLMHFKTQFMEAFNNGSLVSCDESGFDLRCRPVYGYAPKGSQAIVKVPISKLKGKGADRHHSLVMAIHENGVRHHRIFQKSVGGQQFSTFIETAPFPPNSVILLDNHSMHKTKMVREIAHKKGYKLLYTPPYSPEFNPIELMFGITKNRFYKLRYSDHGISNVGEAVEACVSQCASPQTITNCFQHVVKIMHK